MSKVIEKTDAEKLAEEQARGIWDSWITDSSISNDSWVTDLTDDDEKPD